MPETYLALLNESAKVTSDVFSRIDQNLARSNAAQAEANRQQLRVRMSAVQMSEQARQSDQRIKQVNFDNFLRAKQYENEAELMPLRVQTERLRLDAAKLGLQTQKRKVDEDLFSTMTSEMDERAGLSLMDTNNPEHANSILSYRAEWKNRYLNGEQFNATEYGKGLRDLTDKFSTDVKSKDWNAGAQVALDRISPVAGRAYQLQNPIIKRNRNSLAVTYLNISDKEVVNFQKDFSDMYDPAETGQMSVQRRVYRTNLARIDSAISEHQRIASAPKYKDRDEALDRINKEMNRLSEENGVIETNFGSGNFEGMGSEADRAAYRFNLPDGPGEATKDIHGIIHSDSGDQTQENKFSGILDIERALGGTQDNPNSKELRGADYSWFNNSTMDKQSYEFKDAVKKRALDNLDEVEKISSIITPGKFDAILSKIKDTELVPLSEKAREILSRDVELLGVYPAGVTRSSKLAGTSLKFSHKKGSFMDIERSIRSLEDVNDIVSKIPSKADREFVLREIYAGMIAAGVSSTFSK